MHPTHQPFELWTGYALSGPPPADPDPILRLDTDGVALLLSPIFVRAEDWRSLAAAVAEAAADRRIEAVVLAFDVWAAEAAGCAELVDAIGKAHRQKPTASHIERANGVALIAALAAPLVLVEPGAELGLLGASYPFADPAQIDLLPSLSAINRRIVAGLRIARPELPAAAARRLLTNTIDGCQAAELRLVGGLSRDPSATAFAARLLNLHHPAAC